MLLKLLVLQMFQNNVVKTIDFTTFPKIMLLEPFVLQHFQHVAKTIVFTTIPKTRLLKLLVLHLFQHNSC